MVIGWKWPGWFILPNVGWFTHMENQWPFWSTTLSIGWSSHHFFDQPKSSMAWLLSWRRLLMIKPFLPVVAANRTRNISWNYIPGMECPKIDNPIFLSKSFSHTNVIQYHSRHSPPPHVTRGSYKLAQNTAGTALLHIHPIHCMKKFRQGSRLILSVVAVVQGGQRRNPHPAQYLGNPLASCRG